VLGGDAAAGVADRHLNHAVRVWRVVMVISPFSAMAWPALTSRFMNTWLSWEAMQYTWGRVGS
jgi:hypothetical protein